MSDLLTHAEELDGLRGAIPAATLLDHAKEIEQLAAEPKKPSLTKEVAASALGSDWQNFAAGAGKGLTDLARGTKQLSDIPAQWLEKRFPGLSKWAESQGLPSAERSAADTNANIEEARARDKPLSESGAGMAGDFTGQLAGTLLPLGAAARVSAPARALFNPATYKAAAATGALQGALQPTLEDESKVANAAVGAGAGMIGNAAINAVGRLAKPFSVMASAAHDKAVETLTKAGISLDAAQKTGSAFLNKVRSSFSDNPFTAPAQAEFASQQQKGFNRAVLKTVGEDAPAATAEVMSKAQERINGVFKDILDRNKVSINDTVLSRIGSVQAKAAEEERGPVVKIANRILDSIDAEGNIPGQVAYNIRKDLARLSSSSDTTLAYHARQLENSVMDAIHGSLDAADKKAFSEARGQFSNLRRIEGVIDKTGSGDISPARLASVMAQKRNRSASIYGRGPQELVDLAHSGNMLLPDRLPQSGTTPRMILQALPAVIAGGGEAAYSGGDMKKTVAAAAGVYALPKAAQAAMNNPAVSQYLSRGMQGGMTPLRNLLLAPQTNQLVGAASRSSPIVYSQKP